MPVFILLAAGFEQQRNVEHRDLLAARHHTPRGFLAHHIVGLFHGS
jgi:hypothetical protein